MATPAREVLRDAAALLQDTDHVRWRLNQKRIWLNSGLREMALRKPNTKTRLRTVDLVAGTIQSAPSSSLGVLSVIRNHSGGIGRGAVRMTTRSELDMVDPDWHDPGVQGSFRRVKQACVEMIDPKLWYCWPPNDGTGRVEILSAQMPAAIAALAVGDQQELSGYTQEIDVDDVYVNALVHYVVYACYAQDLQAQGNFDRAATAYRMFGEALGVKLTMEAASTPRGGE
jgi:hypothetical protein